MPRAKSESPGRATPPAAKRSQTSGRYTPPIPRDKKHSPVWFPYVLVGLMVAGLIVIICNYAAVLPGGTHTYYLFVGIAAIVAGLIMATFYR